jgi:hypothetical protein
VRGLVVVSLLVLAGCGKGTPPEQHAPDNAKSGEPVKGDPGHVTKVGKGYADDITLPTGTGQPPVQTAAPITAGKLASLRAMQFPGFVRADAPGGKDGVTYTTRSRPRLQVTVMIDPCAPGACTKMDVDAWRAKPPAELEQYVAQQLRDLPDTEFTTEAVALDGATVIGTYQLGLISKVDENGNPEGAVTDAYVEYYNDGANRITVVAEYRDDLPKTMGQLKGAAPRRTLQMMATRFLDFFTQNWGPSDAGSSAGG